MLERLPTLPASAVGELLTLRWCQAQRNRSSG